MRRIKTGIEIVPARTFVKLLAARDLFRVLSSGRR